MERLTIPAERLPDGGTRMQVVDARAVKEHAMELYWRLKKYEDTGLSPDDVTDLMGSHAVAIGELAKMPKWIPVTERLPEEGDFWFDDMENAVLLYTPVDGCMHIGWYTGKYRGRDTWNTLTVMRSVRQCKKKVTHWMPLPKPPKEVRGDA